MYLMAEMVPCVSECVQWLPALKQHSILLLMIRSLDEHLKVMWPDVCTCMCVVIRCHLQMGTDEEFVEAILSFFLAACGASTVRQFCVKCVCVYQI